jgi:hypothetical protein
MNLHRDKGGALDSSNKRAYSGHQGLPFILLSDPILLGHIIIAFVLVYLSSLRLCELCER